MCTKEEKERKAEPDSQKKLTKKEAETENVCKERIMEQK